MDKAESALRSQMEALRRARRFARRARERCEELGLRFVNAYLVGSRARGDYTVESDIDVVLVVDGIKDRNMLERLELFKDLLEPRIELRVYDLSEWEGEESTWIREMRKEAKSLLDEG